MLKSKHSGWTWELRRTPFGGGGGFNPLDSISSALGTDGGGGGLLGGVEDLGQSIGSGLAEVDKFVGREVPGGWVLPAALAAAYATGYIDPSLFATEAAATAGAEAGAGAIATEAGQAAFFDALAAGASSAEAVNAGIAADAALTAGSAAALHGPTYGELGITGVEGGFAGPTYGELGYTGIDQGAAVAAADAAAQSGMSAKDVLTNANRLKNISKLLTGSDQSKIFGKNVPNAQQFQQYANQNLAQATPEQFGGYYQMNKNPFTFSNPLANALANKQTSGFDVSGTGGQSLNTQNQASNLAKLLA